MIINIRAGILVILALIVVLLPQQMFAMSFSPSITDAVLMPGEEASLEFAVENTSSDYRAYAASVYGVTFDQESGEPEFGSLTGQYASWFSLDTYDFALAPSASRALKMQVAVPDNATADTYTFALVVRESTEDTSLYLSTGMSSLFFLTVGSPQTHAEIVKFSAESSVIPHLPITFTVEVANNGERIAQPYGIVRITDVFGGEVASLDVNEDFRRVPSGLVRTFTTQWGEVSISQGLGYELWRELTAGVGLFTAELVMSPYPGAEATLQATTRLLVFPWRVAAIACGIFGLVYFVVVRKQRRF